MKEGWVSSQMCRFACKFNSVVSPTPHKDSDSMAEPHENEADSGSMRFTPFVGLFVAAWCIGLIAWNFTATDSVMVARGAAVLTAIVFSSIASFQPQLKTIAFTAWVLTFVLIAFLFPGVFIRWGDFELKQVIVPLIQLIMFGMGATLTIGDFSRVLKMPRAVLIGIFLQFSIMPVVGFGLAKAFGFEPAVAAGVILIGACPGGVASNLMTFLSKGNVALSVTMTACSTLIAPIMTPLLMSTLAGEMVEVVFIDWVINILKIIIVPIAIGLILNTVLRAMSLRGEWIDRCLSWIAMAGICVIVGIIIGGSRDKLLTIGIALVAASVIHNLVGYLLGYFGARAAKLDETTCRTVAIEVGLQNGGMATALAIGTLKDPLAALGPAIFGPWMNISGSILASWWAARPPEMETVQQSDEETT